MKLKILSNDNLKGIENPVLKSLSLLPVTMVSTVKAKTSKFDS